MSNIIEDAFGRINHWVRNENDFTYNGLNYERDIDSGRCYVLEASRSLRPEMDGALVRRRISAEGYARIYGYACRDTGYKNA